VVICNFQLARGIATSRLQRIRNDEGAELQVVSFKMQDISR